MQLRHRHHEHDVHPSHSDEAALRQQHSAEHDVEDPKVHDRPPAMTKEAVLSNNKHRKVRKRKRRDSNKQQQNADAVTYVKRFLVLVVVIFAVGGGYMLYIIAIRPRFVHPPKLAFLPNDFRVSVVLMNHYRPRMIRESGMLETILAHDHIGEVLLCHSNPKTRFEYTHPKVRNIDAVAVNVERGLSLRFYFCYTEAANEYVIILDDDQELTSAAIDTLLQTFAIAPDRIVGRYGRTFDSSSWSSHNHGYNTRTVFGKIEVVLTKLLVAPRDYCGNFLRYESIVHDMLPDSNPLWNGEDIFFSLVANHVNKVPPDGPFRNQAVFFGGVSEASNDLKDDDSGAHDVSGNMDRHIWYDAVWTHDAWLNYTAAAQRARKHTAYRGNLWSTAKARLADLSEEDEERLARQFAEAHVDQE